MAQSSFREVSHPDPKEMTSQVKPTTSNASWDSALVRCVFHSKNLAFAWRLFLR